MDVQLTSSEAREPQLLGGSSHKNGAIKSATDFSCSVGRTCALVWQFPNGNNNLVDSYASKLAHSGGTWSSRESWWWAVRSGRRNGVDLVDEELLERINADGVTDGRAAPSQQLVQLYQARTMPTLVVVLINTF